MADKHACFPAIVCHRQQSEKHWLLRLITPTHGLQACLYRTSRKSGQTLPDLFDHVELSTTAARQGDLQFAREYVVLWRAEGLAQNWRALQLTVEFFRIVQHFAEFTQDPLPLYEHCLACLKHFAQAEHPECVALKSIYLLARLEGLPAQASWLAGLPSQRMQQARNLLRTPLSEIPSDLAQEASPLLQSLQHWLSHTTDIPPTAVHHR